MVRELVVLCMAAAILACAGSARADAPARDLASAHVIVDADRLMPLVTYESVTVTDPNNSSDSATVNAVSTALFTNGAMNTFYTLPRLGLDTVVGPGFTLGASAWVYTNLSESISAKTAATTIPSQDLPKTTYWGVAPRIGYIVPLGDFVALWPRAGIEYHKENSSTVSQTGSLSPTPGGEQEYQLAADIDAALVFTPWNHIGVTVTAYGAIPIVGGVSGLGVGNTAIATTGALDASQLAVGLTFGLLVFF